MAVELVYRFLAGGFLVSLFALLGEMFKPKRFSGLFGAAPSLAIATLAFASVKEGRAYVATEGLAMVGGAVAFLVYAAACVVLAKRERVPVWLGATVSWVSWFVVAGVFGCAARAIGVGE